VCGGQFRNHINIVIRKNIMGKLNRTYTDHELKIIEEALDEVMTKYETNNDYILERESDKKSFLYLFKGLFPKKRKCVIPECKNRSVRNSHTIQKAHSLKVIAESNHIYSPIFNKKTGKLEMTRSGINQASIFPGFCSKHERIFHTFENSKDVDSEEAVQLQIFRTISRELVVKKSELAQLLAMKDHYLKFREKKILELFYAAASEKISNMAFPESITIDFEDKNLAAINDEIEKVSSDISFFTSNFFEPLYRYIFFDGSSDDPLYIYKIEASEKIPVTLAGRGAFHIEKDGIQHEIHAILNILPLVDGTAFYIAVELKNREFLNYYIAIFQQTGLPGLNLAETWVVRGSDHWFIQPSVWDELEDDRKEQVLKDVLDVGHHIAEIYNYSIFNSLRRKILATHEEARESADPEVRRQIDSEIGKL